MEFGIPEVLLLFAMLVYVYMLIDRICKCFEHCSTAKSIGSAYGNPSLNWLSDMVKKKKTES